MTRRHTDLRLPGRFRSTGCVVLLVIVASACGGGSGTTTSPTPTTFSLSGTVTNSTDGSGISGATVSIADGSNAGRSATTDASGNYSFTGLQQAGFTIVDVSASYYVSQSSGVTLTSNQTLSVQLVRISFAGSWTGTTSQSRTMSFSVASNSNAVYSLAISAAGPRCNFTRNYTWLFPNPLPITDGNFTSQDGAIAGTFQSTTTASGTFTLANTNCGDASGTWTATKQ